MDRYSSYLATPVGTTSSISPAVLSFAADEPDATEAGAGFEDSTFSAGTDVSDVGTEAVTYSNATDGSLDGVWTAADPLDPAPEATVETMETTAVVEPAVIADPVVPSATPAEPGAPIKVGKPIGGRRPADPGPPSEARPGRIIAGGILADVLVGTPAADRIFGGEGDDEIRAGGGGDAIFGGGGGDLMVGGRGFDTVHFTGSVRDYQIQRFRNPGEAVVADLVVGRDGRNVMRGVEQIAFKDRTIFLDGTNNAPYALSDRGRGLIVRYGEVLRVPTSRLLANDVDFDGDRLKVTGVRRVCCGSCPGGKCRGPAAKLEGDEIVYDPGSSIQWALAAGDRIEDTYVYDVSDGKGGVDTRNVTFLILAPGAKPTPEDLAPGRGATPPVIVAPPDGPLRTPTTEPAPIDASTGNTSGGTTRLPGGAVTAYGLWDDTAVPTTLADPDTLGVELGVKFTADTGGSITGIRFYKSAANTGTHAGTLWTSTGTSLGSVTFTNETTSGWQTAYFANPITITAGNTYVASYHAPNGGYSVDDGYFSSAYTNGALTALASGASGGNGVYRYSSTSAFPTQSYNASNYWVDVLYESSGTLNRAPKASDDSGFSTPLDTVLRIPYADLLANDLDPDGDTLTISGVSAGTGGTAALDAATSDVVFTPNAGFEGFADFTYTVADPEGATDSASVAVTVGTPPETFSLWSNATTPTVAAANDGSAVELGVKFTADIGGTITGIKFYKSTLNTGTHVGNLWTATGANLGSVTFTAETASGWQTATFAEPISITAGTTYVASYHTTSGYYSIDGNYFGTGYSNGPLTALSNSESGGNGVYAYGNSSQFPSASWTASNYWVDVVFNPSDANNQPPVAAGDSATTDEDTPININVLANDSDPEGGALRVASLDLTGTQGNVTINADNTIAYAPGAAFQTLGAGQTATDYFVYTAADAQGATAQATVAVTVTGVDDTVSDIVLENMKQGSPQSEWQIDGDGSGIEGFATGMSIDVGQTVGFKVNTTATNYRLDIYRMGYYGGMGARKVATVEPSLILSNGQAAPQYDAATGLYDAANWLETASWQVPTNAVSGVYFAKLVREDGVAGSNHIYFIVRDDQQASDIVFQTSDTTWQAYNQWGGNSFYTGEPAGRAFKLSYNRPFGSAGHPVNRPLFDAEYPMIRWLEMNGFDVSYVSGIDTARDGTGLLDHKVFMTTGHDEYWSGRQRTNVEAARDAGVNLAFFSGNDVYWKTRWEADSNGTPYRTLVSYKETWANSKVDPSDEWTGTWRDPRFSPPSDGGRPENELIGNLFTVDAYRLDTMEIPAEYGKARFWRNTGIDTLAAGTTATLTDNVLGYEWNENLDNGYRPAGTINLSSTTIDVPNYLYDYGSTVGPGTGTHEMTLYRAPSGALVFGAGTTRWSWGLDDNHVNETSVVDPRMQQATINLFADMGVQPETLQAGMVRASGSTDTTAPTATTVTPSSGDAVLVGSTVTISGTASDVGGVVAGVEVSTDGGSTWREAAGRANWSYTWQPPAEGTYTILSRAIDDSVNIGAASTPTSVTVSAPVGQASIWGDSVVPTLVAANDPSGVELGLKFQSTKDGYVTGIRFYKSSANTGTHVGNLWTATGSNLGSVTFANETSNGWQTAYFADPIPISANTTYVASYHTSTGYYSADVDYFSSAGVTSGPLVALASPDSGGNGVYAYGSGGFPGNTFRSTNYWTDVTFTETLAV